MDKSNLEHTHIMNRRSLPNIRPPQLILLHKSGLKSVRWETSADVTSAAAPVTSMDPDHFTKQFFDFRDERLLSR